MNEYLPVQCTFKNKWKLADFAIWNTTKQILFFHLSKDKLTLKKDAKYFTFCAIQTEYTRNTSLSLIFNPHYRIKVSSLGTQSGINPWARSRNFLTDVSSYTFMEAIVHYTMILLVVSVSKLHKFKKCTPAHHRGRDLGVCVVANSWSLGWGAWIQESDVELGMYPHQSTVGSIQMSRKKVLVSLPLITENKRTNLCQLEQFPLKNNEIISLSLHHSYTA